MNTLRSAIPALFAALLALSPGWSTPAWSQDPNATDDYPTRETLPEGAVLVVKLVSAQEIIPTTGVVVAYGRVILPAAFVADTMDGGPDLAVMDGGGSIALNGRPATVREVALDGGLALLDVPGLMAPPVTLAQRPGDDGDELRFGAFPPARLMASGHGPMWLPAQLNANVTAGVYGLAESPKLPNVTGPLFNRCDQWVGYSLAMGEPDLASPLPPIVMFDAELRRVLTRLGAPALSTAPCERTVQDAPAAPAPAESAVEADDEPVSGSSADADMPEDGGEATTATAGLDAAGDASETRPASPTESPQIPDPADVTASAGDATGSGTERPDAVARAAAENPQPAWTRPPVIIAAGTLVVLAILVLLLRGFRGRRRAEADDEPDTVELAPAPVIRGSESPPLQATPAAGWPPGADAWLRVIATTKSGDELRDRCGVDHQAFACVLGRADADLVLDHPSLSRAHLRIDGRDGTLAIGDLGSTNGTALGSARCQPGEILYIEPDTPVGIGELAVRFQLDFDEDSPE